MATFTYVNSEKADRKKTAPIKASSSKSEIPTKSTKSNEISKSSNTQTTHTPEELEKFFNSIQDEKKNRKIAKKEAHINALIANRDGKLEELAMEESIGENGKRAIGYQILKNKGLTARRKKENRNARVKKRNKYDAAKKKIKSVRAVYSGQQGPYAGELTGISKKISRSIKLN